MAARTPIPNIVGDLKVNLNRLSFAFAAAACVFSASALAEKAPKPKEPDQKGFASTKATDPKFVIRVEHGIHAKEFAGGLAKFALEQFNYQTPPGDYPVQFRSYSDQSEWFLVPTDVAIGGQRQSSTRVAETVSGCPSRYTSYLAIDRNSGAVEPFSYEVVERTCREGGSKRQGGWQDPLVIIAQGSVRILSQAEVDAEREAAAAQQSQLAHAARAKEAELSPLKRRIGTKLCKTEGRVVYVGFTEAVSPDLDRIQIRVTAATSGPPRFNPDDGFREQILWDEPVNWTLCD